ncbi:MAG: ankyrin repeat domain-containing protein [Pirellulaceae bacterium]
MTEQNSSESDWSELHKAACKGDVGALRYLLDSGIDVNTRVLTTGDTALHIAAYHGNEACIDMLLDRGAEVGVVNSQNDTPLHLAALAAQPTALVALLKHGADADITNLRQQRAIDYLPNVIACSLSSYDAVSQARRILERASSSDIASNTSRRFTSDIINSHENRSKKENTRQ